MRASSKRHSVLGSTITVLEKGLLPVFDLFVRLWIAAIFWRSGSLKFESWENTLTLFTYEHPIAGVSPEIAAFFAIVFELSCPILLAAGFLTRLAALPLIGMTIIIQFTYMDIVEHYYWLMLLSYLLLKGPGTLSVDHFIRRKLFPA